MCIFMLPMHSDTGAKRSYFSLGLIYTGKLIRRAIVQYFPTPSSPGAATAVCKPHSDPKPCVITGSLPHAGRPTHTTWVAPAVWSHVGSLGAEAACWDTSLPFLRLPTQEQGGGKGVPDHSLLVGPASSPLPGSEERALWEKGSQPAVAGAGKCFAQL